MTASIAMTACSKQAVPTAIPEDAKIEQQVEKLLSEMDLDAKIGQMTELAIDVLGETNLPCIQQSLCGVLPRPIGILHLSSLLIHQ